MRSLLTCLSLSLTMTGALHSEVILDFESTYQEILLQALELKAADAQIAMRGTARWQAEVHANPTLTVSSDTYEHIFDGENKEYFAGMTHSFEFGDKHAARVDVAQAEHYITVWEREILERKLFGAVLHAFINIAVAQESLQLAEDQLILVTENLANLATKNLDSTTAHIECASIETAYQAIQQQQTNLLESLSTAKRELHALWDTHAPEFESVNFAIYLLAPPLPFDKLSHALNDSPEMARAQALLDKATKIYQLERAQRIPDVAIQVGVNAEKKTRNAFLGVGVNIPLPSSDQNRSNIGRAFREKEEAFYSHMDISSRQRSTLATLYSEWMHAYEQAIDIRDHLLPQANGAYQLACRDYNEGKCDLAERSNTQKALYIVQQQYLNAAGNYHHKKAEVLKLTGYRSNAIVTR